MARDNSGAARRELSRRGFLRVSALGSGTLEILTKYSPGQLAWVEVPEPDGDPVDTKDQGGAFTQPGPMTK